MASASLDNDSILWSDTGETIRDVVYKHELPALVKVSEGYYSHNDAESFSCGDLLKLDFVKTFMKVSARVGEHMYEYRHMKYNDIGRLEWKDEILIPLGYKGKLKIVRKDECKKVFYTIKELIQEYPRFIRTQNPLSKSDGKIPYIIPAGSELELDRILPNQGLVFKYGDKEGLMGFEDSGKFVPLEDNTEYTLQEVVDKLPLPQCVKFIESEFHKIMTNNLDEALENIQHFSGILQIQKVITQHVVVGHHKPASTTDKTETFCERSVVLLPLESPIVNEIEVLTPIITDTEEYELVMARNFSQDLNMEMVDGGLYLELAKNPKVHRLSNVADDKPPLVPPRQEQKRCPELAEEGKHIHVPKSANKKDPEDEEYHNLENALESTTDKERVQSSIKMTRSETADDGSDNGEEVKDCDYPDISRMEEKDKSDLPKMSDNGEEVKDCDYPDVSRMEEKDKSGLPKMSDKYNSIKDRRLPLTPHQKNGDNLPIGMVLPQNNEAENSRVDSLTALSISELCKVFEDCALIGLAHICESERLDGAFINALTESELKGEPFSLTKIQLMKIKQIKKGWRPKV